MADPYANPYLMPQPAPDWRQVLSNALIGVGGGIASADASGRGWAAGIGPGLMYANQMTGQQRQQQQQEQMKRWQLSMMAREYEDKRAERERKLQMQQAAADEYAAPGLNYQPPAVRMGEGSYDTKLAGYEGGSKNGGMVFNELGSGAFGPFQFMPATYAGVRAKAPHLNLPEDMTKATREQWGQAHDVLKADNAQGLQAAGIQPTPENLYLAHRFGVGGATAVLRSDPNKPLAEILPIDWQRQNPDMRGQTAGGFRRLAAERMGGVGVPYQASGQTTEYALQPNALPSFDDPTLSLSPRPNSRFMPGVLPNSDVAPSFTAPVMPQPQGPQGVVPAQFTPPPATPAAPASDGPPQLVLPPKPMLPPADAARIRNGILTGVYTKAQADAERDRVINDIWGPQKEAAKARYQQESENYRFNRGQASKDAWETLDPKNAQMMLGPGYDNGKSYQRNKVTGEIKPIGGSLVTVNTGDKLLPGQKKVDEKFADQYIEFVSGGGFAESAKMLEQLEEVRTALKSGASLTGPIIGMQGDTLLSFTNPNAMAMRDAVMEVAQRNLRQILGAQFTAEEGEMLLARTYNPRLSEEENAKRIDRLMTQIKTAMEAKIDSARYFEEHGTLRGWKGKLPRMSDFEPQPIPEEKASPDAAKIKAVREKYGLISAPEGGIPAPAAPVDVRKKYGLE